MMRRGEGRAGVEALDRLSEHGLAALVEIRFLEHTPERVRARMPVGSHLRAPNGRVHGAALVALADTTCGNGTILALGGRAGGFATLELSTHFLRAPAGDEVECVARLVHRGSTVHHWEAELRSEGRPCALFRCTQLVLDERGTSDGPGPARESSRSRLRFVTVDVFTDRRFTGNPLAVVLHDGALDDDRMKAITREFGYSETIFLAGAGTTREGSRRWRTRIFTPGREVPFAGHPTVGSAFALRHLGLVEADESFVLDQAIGPVEVGFRQPARGAPGPLQAWFGMPAPPRPGPDVEVPAPTLTAVLGLTPADLDPAHAIQVWEAGPRMIVLRLASNEAVGRARLDLARWRAALQEAWANELYLVGPPGPDGRVRVRLFAPGAGIEEDPATGSAACVLAHVLASESSATAPDGPLAWTVLQGHELGRPSQIGIEARVVDQRVVEVRAGGAGQIVFEGWLTV